MKSKPQSADLPINSILVGDCIELLKGLPAESVDLIFADPPYNLQLESVLNRPDQSLVDAVTDKWDQFSSFAEYDKFTRAWLHECRRVLKPNGSMWVIGTYHNIFRVGTALQDEGFWLLNDIVWVKSNPMPQFHGVRFCNSHETLIWAGKSKASRPAFQYKSLKLGNEDLQARSDWYIPICSGPERLRDADGDKVHSTQKPEALIHHILVACTQPGDVVLDPFFGSGTTGAVAKRLGRSYIGIEREKEYAIAATERIDAVIPAPELSISIIGKPKRVAFSHVVELELLPAGCELRLGGTEFFATVRADGALDCDGQIKSIHGLGKALLNTSSCNGWDHWLYLNAQTHVWEPISFLREVVRAMVGEKSEMVDISTNRDWKEKQ
ncbi:MAG: DNA methyltransferase [Chthonomonadales bacterium]